MLDRVFQRGAHAVPAAVRRIGRYKIGHIAHHEKIAGPAVGKKHGIHAGITAGDDESKGILPLPELLKKRLLGVIPAMLKTTETGRKTIHQRMLAACLVRADDMEGHDSLGNKKILKNTHLV